MNRDFFLGAQRLINRLFYRGLGGYLALDGVLLLCFQGPWYAWLMLLSIECIMLFLGLQQNSQLVHRVLTPLEALEETADVLGRTDLDTSDLRRLAQRLDSINVGHLDDRVTIPGGREELSALATAINSMLERIDRGYQAQARFVSDASHELRTPIAVIQGYANMLDRWGKDDPEARQEAITAIRQEVEGMSELVQQLLFLARGDNETQVVHMALMDFSDMIRDVLQETELMETGRQLCGEISDGIFLTADAGLIKQAVRILVDNAIKYTPEGGSITLRLAKEGKLAAFSVTDNGCGISEEELSHVFERFYRAENSRARQTGGTGLGLSIAKWIATRHDGSIRVVSSLGIGSRFTLLLPLAGEQP